MHELHSSTNEEHFGYHYAVPVQQHQIQHARLPLGSQIQRSRTHCSVIRPLQKKSLSSFEPSPYLLSVSALNDGNFLTMVAQT